MQTLPSLSNDSLLTNTFILLLLDHSASDLSANAYADRDAPYTTFLSNKSLIESKINEYDHLRTTVRI